MEAAAQGNKSVESANVKKTAVPRKIKPVPERI